MANITEPTSSIDPGDIDLSQFPPSIVLLTSKCIDTTCSWLGCEGWRDSTIASLLPASWTVHRVPSLDTLLPDLPSYSEYMKTQTPVGTPYFSPLALYKYAFQTPTTALSAVTTFDSLIVLLGLVLLLRLIKSFALPYFSSIGRKAGRETHGVEWELQNEIRIVKFGEYVFRLFYHFVISLYGTIYCVWKQPWWTDTTVLFVSYPYHYVAPSLAWYYLFNAAYNIDALISLLKLSFVVRAQLPWKNGRLRLPLIITWSSTVRGDFREMMIHHIVTNLLIFGSSHFRFPRIGSMVFWVHDISDVPVDLSKLANFLKWKTTTTVCFVTMCLLWFIFRLLILPFHIYRAVVMEAYLVMAEHVEPILYATYKTMFVVLIGSIILLHVLWFTMMLRMGYLLVKKGEAHDLSEHKSGEDQHKQKGKQETFTKVVVENGETAMNGNKRNGHGSSNGSNKKTN